MKNQTSEASGNIKEKKEETRERKVPVCSYAPEWAEHARFYREDEPCDDSRMGIRPCADDDKGCPVTDSRPAVHVQNRQKKPRS